ncbi:MAG: hypothetical protein DSZ20_06015 [Candidatus Thioglobus sp.]|nr:MAG: hypothetical protein DSZ20_06015 [Candidatus Thioglobus sp.]
MSENNTLGSLQFSAPKVTDQENISSANLYFSSPKRATQENAGGTDFSSKDTTLENEKVVTPIKMSLNKNDLLYSLLSTTPKDTTLENEKLVTPIKSTLFKSESDQSTYRILSWSEKQKKIKLIKEESENLKKENLIAQQVRNKDVDTQLEFDLNNLIAKLPVDRKILVQKMQDDLIYKIRLLDADTAIKITDIRMLSIDKSAFALAGVEKKVLSAKSTAEDGVIEHIFATEPDRYYRIREEEKALHVQYIVDMERIKLQSKNNPRLDILEKDVQAFEAANQKIINTRIAELEAQRVAEALIIEVKVKVKHQAIIDAFRAKSESSLKEYGDTVEHELAVAEKVALDQLESKNNRAILSRESQRRADNKQYIREIKKKIQQAQLTREKKVRDTNTPSRDARVIAITNNLNNSIKYIEASRVQTLASLKAQQEQLHQSKIRSLKASFGAKEQVLIQISKQKELKVLSLFKTENSAILTKENKAIEAINKEINARVNDEIKAALDSYEAFRKEEAAIRKEEAAKAKKIRAEKPKESTGFFKSLF